MTVRVLINKKPSPGLKARLSQRESEIFVDRALSYTGQEPMLLYSIFCLQNLPDANHRQELSGETHSPRLT
jgi:hypothetical protein